MGSSEHGGHPLDGNGSHEAIATYQAHTIASPQGERVAGIDLGEVHMAAAHDGTDTHILNGRILRSKVQYRNKLQATLNSRIVGKMKKWSQRRKRVIRSKKKQLKKIEYHIRELEHKQTSKLITTLHQAGVPAAGHWRCARHPASD